MTANSSNNLDLLQNKQTFEGLSERPKRKQKPPKKQNLWILGSNPKSTRNVLTLPHLSLDLLLRLSLSRIDKCRICRQRRSLMMDIENTHGDTRCKTSKSVVNIQYYTYTLEHDITYSIFVNIIIEHNTKETLVFHLFIKIFNGSKRSKSQW